MLLLRKPSAQAIQKFLEEQRTHVLTYTPGEANDLPPVGFAVDHTRIKLGNGTTIFTTARSALENWQQFHLGWLEAFPSTTPICEGENISVVVRSLGLWILNACRIVRTFDEEGKFGFTYATLPGHVEMGEERFLIQRDDEGNIWYDILAYSRPRHPLARLGYPYARRLQKRFGRESAERMLKLANSDWGEAISSFQ